MRHNDRPEVTALQDTGERVQPQTILLNISSVTAIAAGCQNWTHLLCKNAGTAAGSTLLSPELSLINPFPDQIHLFGSQRLSAHGHSGAGGPQDPFQQNAVAAVSGDNRGPGCSATQQCRFRIKTQLPHGRIDVASATGFFEDGRNIALELRSLRACESGCAKNECKAKPEH